MGLTWIIANGSVNTNSWAFTSVFGPYYMGQGPKQYAMDFPGAWLVGSIALYAMLFAPLIVLEWRERRQP